jgi:chromosome partitioning protein
VGSVKQPLHNTAYILATRHRQKVLLLDLDQQGNASEIYVDDKNKEPSIGKIFREKNVDVSPLIHQASVHGNPVEHMDIIHSNISLSKALKEIPVRTYKEKILEKALTPIAAQYNHIILDCPASIEDSVINAIYFSKRFLIPVEMGGFASSAIQDVLELIAEIKEYKSLKELLQSRSVLFLKNKVDGRGTSLNKKIEEEIKDILPYMMHSWIRNSLSISKANLEKTPLIEYKECSNVVKDDYINYVNELIK